MRIIILCLLIAAGLPPTVAYEPMMSGRNGFQVETAFTVGALVGGYRPPGILDGSAAYNLDQTTVRVLVNHELGNDQAYVYSLANGTALVGARVSYFDFDKADRSLIGAGLAYHTVYDRYGEVVEDPVQINEGAGGLRGFDRFCSAQGVAAGDYGFVDDIFFSNEETSVARGHPHGGSVWVLDVAGGAIWAAPALGRGSWENVTPLETASEEYVALLLGDDSAPAPLYLYVGRKDAVGDDSFLDRNGLAAGNLFAWSAGPGIQTPQAFNGTGSSVDGHFVPVTVRDEGMAGEPGYDAQGYLDDLTLRAQAFGKGAFMFSRPEDIHTDPENGSHAVMASTGHGQSFPADIWGTTYLIEVDLNLHTADEARARVTILYDGDDYPDMGIRSPDNLVWADNGLIYVQEDRATTPGSLFGSVSGRETSIWQLQPRSSEIVQIAEMEREAVAPEGSTDGAPDDLGAWESSGMIDVTDFFPTVPDGLLFLATVQAHSIRDGVIADENLVQGGQLIFIHYPPLDH